MDILNGYGASIEYDGVVVRLIAGKVQAKIWKTDAVAFPVEDIITLGYRRANPFVNGQLKFTTIRPADAYAALGRGMFDFVPDNGLVIHWRRKDQAAFGALHEELASKVDPADEERKRTLSIQVRAEYAAAREAAIKQAGAQRPDDSGPAR